MLNFFDDDLSDVTRLTVNWLLMLKQVKVEQKMTHEPNGQGEWYKPVLKSFFVSLCPADNSLHVNAIF